MITAASIHWRAHKSRSLEFTLERDCHMLQATVLLPLVCACLMKQPWMAGA